jgi:hypothetical protein
LTQAVVRKKIRIPMIGTWQWSKADYDIPLTFHLPGLEANLRLAMWDSGSRQRETTWQAVLALEFESPSRDFLAGLTTSGKKSVETARRIHDCYLKVNEQFESLLYTIGKTRSMLPEDPIPFEAFFTDDSYYGDSVTYQLDNGPESVFAPKLVPNRRSLRPVFKRAQLIDRPKWQRMQKSIDAEEFASPEIIELFRIRSRFEWREMKIATIEAAVFAETALRDFAKQALIACGISNKKLKDLEGDLSFAILLNAVLPLALPQKEAERLRSHIVAVDLLRKIRNDLVHGNITEAEIGEERVRDGIEGTLKIIEVIKSTLKKT